MDELASILLQLLTRQLKKSSAFYLKKVEDCHKIADGMLKELRKAGVGISCQKAIRARIHM